MKPPPGEGIGGMAGPEDRMRGRGVGAMTGVTLLALAACADNAAEEMQPGFEMLSSRNYAGAEAYFADAVAEDPENAYAHLNLAVAHQAQGDIAMAREHYQKAIAHGEGVATGQTTYEGQVKTEESTVAAVAAYNLSNLPQ